MIKRAKRYWISNYQIISKDQAERLDLEFVTNVYGDRINELNCRSIWKDKKGNPYRCKELVENVNNFLN